MTSHVSQGSITSEGQSTLDGLALHIGQDCEPVSESSQRRMYSWWKLAWLQGERVAVVEAVRDAATVVHGSVLAAKKCIGG